MGDEFIYNNAKITIETNDGRKTILEDVERIEIIDEDIRYEDNPTSEYDNVMLKYIRRRNFSAEIYVKRLTKKKFIKMLMSKGYGRNLAHIITEKVLKRYGTYNYVILSLY